MNLARLRVSAAVVSALALTLFALSALPASAQTAQTTAPAKAPAKKSAAFDASPCLGCHAPVKALYESGKHKGLACNGCHDGTDAHLADASKRPTTKTDLANCGACHQNQYKTYAQMDWHRTARFEKKQMAGPAPDPSYDLLMSPHGFTKEHNLPRSHTFALLDQFVVDRAFGGRFAPKEGWRYLASAGDFNVMDVVVDQYPDNTDQKPFKPGTAAAANPVCLSCKTQDHILDWAYMGDPVPGAKWSRTSKVVELAKASKHALNCIFCHDPHAAKPRIVRDALIEVVTRTDFPTLYAQDARKTKVDVKDMGVRGYTRKIGLLERYDGKLQCGQCHVEYNCNPGFNPNTGEAIPMADKRTNYFPFVQPQDILKAYDHIQFRDFRNQFTGAALWKAQHPDVETYYNSTHEKLGVDCTTCHMPKLKDAKTGKLLHVALADQPEELPEGNLPAVPQPVERDPGEVRDRVAVRALPGESAQRRVLAVAAHQQVRPGAARRRAGGCAESGARKARRRARQLGMVDRGERRVVPQSGAVEDIARELRHRVAGRDQDPRRRDQGEAGGRRAAGNRRGGAKIAFRRALARTRAARTSPFGPRARDNRDDDRRASDRRCVRRRRIFQGASNRSHGALHSAVARSG